MRIILILLGACALLAGCAHNYRGGTGDLYDADYDRGTGNVTTSDMNTTPSQGNHIEKSRQPEYPSETNPRLDTTF
jgi:hypothetical protein